MSELAIVAVKLSGLTADTKRLSLALIWHEGTKIPVTILTVALIGPWKIDGVVMYLM